MFEFKELEIIKPADDPAYNPAEDLHVLEELWIEKLSPFNDKGYNKPPKAGPTSPADRTVNTAAPLSSLWQSASRSPAPPLTKIGGTL